ncbi:hypothetical protein T484DRAFT_1829006 [Baffinella frigidus]|nr:hypothetical protein T484DRAFT_1829006 [Cryptophyta sp. CCMP2293]
MNPAQVNTVNPSYGRRGAIPQSLGNDVSVEAEPSVRLGADVDDSISLIRPGGDCREVGDNPSEQRVGDASGWMVAGGTDFLLTRTVTDRLADQAPGVYLVCFKAANSATFIATGVSLLVQDSVRRMMVNGVALLRSSAPLATGSLLAYCMVNGVALLRSSAPLAAGSLLAYCVDAACSMPGVGDASLSLIPASQECEDTQLLGAGDVPGGDFGATGLSVRIHDDILRLEVNGVSPNDGLRIGIPKATAGGGSSLSYSTAKPGDAGDAVSLIPLSADCASPSDNPPSGAPRASGHMASSGLDREIAASAGLNALPMGRYQVCFRAGRGGAGGFQSTGLSATLQDAAV